MVAFNALLFGNVIIVVGTQLQGGFSSNFLFAGYGGTGNIFLFWHNNVIARLSFALAFGWESKWALVNRNQPFVKIPYSKEVVRKYIPAIQWEMAQCSSTGSRNSSDPPSRSLFDRKYFSQLGRSLGNS